MEKAGSFWLVEPWFGVWITLLVVWNIEVVCIPGVVACVLRVVVLYQDPSVWTPGIQVCIPDVAVWNPGVVGVWNPGVGGCVLMV